MNRTPIALAAMLVVLAAAPPAATASPDALSATCSATVVTPVTPLSCTDSYAYTCPGPFACLVQVTCTIVGSGVVGCDPGTSDSLDPVCTVSLTSASCHGYFRIPAGITQSGARTCTSDGSLAVAVTLTCNV